MPVKTKVKITQKQLHIIEAAIKGLVEFVESPQWSGADPSVDDVRHRCPESCGVRDMDDLLEFLYNRSGGELFAFRGSGGRRDRGIIEASLNWLYRHISGRRVWPAISINHMRDAGHEPGATSIDDILAVCQLIEGSTGRPGARPVPPDVSLGVTYTNSSSSYVINPNLTATYPGS